MKLQELLKYNPITIQCHDNRDADANNFYPVSIEQVKEFFIA